MKRQYFVSAAALAVGLFSGPGAEAVDGHIFHGSMCGSIQPSSTPYDDGVYREALGLRVDEDDQNGFAAFISCPIIRDETNNTNGISDLEVRVDHNGAGSMSCQGMTFDAFGNTLKGVLKPAPVGNNKVLDFGNAINISATKGPYYVSCTMTGGDTIHSLFLQEY